MDREKVLNHSLDSFVSLGESKGVVIAAWDEDRKELVVERDSEGREKVLGLSFSAGQGGFGAVILNPGLLTINGDEYLKLADQCENEARLWGKPDPVMVIPMLLHGELKGAVALYKIQSGDFELEVKRDYLQGLANQISIFLENTRLYRLVSHDQLTQLYTHNFLEAEMSEMVKQSKRYNLPFTYIILDLDHFKQINDEFGHLVGNQVLRALVRTMRSVSRDSDLLARYGGDEFEIILPQTDETGALAYAEKLRKAVERTEIVSPDGIKIRITISVGLSPVFTSNDSVTAIQTRADQALYEAKERGRNCVMAYRPES